MPTPQNTSAISFLFITIEIINKVDTKTPIINEITDNKVNISINYMTKVFAK